MAILELKNLLAEFAEQSAILFYGCNLFISEGVK